MSVVIKVEGLGKCYEIRHKQGARYQTLRDTIAGSIVGAFKTRKDEVSEKFWALSDLNFEIHAGERVGVVGRNGAGKSTLLKLLSRITEPTCGRIQLRGRVASLLEVGTGFHPELTGRENIFLNGAILGMRRSEIRSRFDEIVDFSGVERFLDTPVKRYSSGMYMRLAFSVAAHLDSDVLIIDEVLAVGDAEFQKKCVGKVDDLTHSGRTLIFVSHNNAIVRKLCNRGILLNAGRVACVGDVAEVIDAYWNHDKSTTPSLHWEDGIANMGEKDFKLYRISVVDAMGGLKSGFHTDETIQIRIEYSLLKPMKGLRLGFQVHSRDGTLVFENYDSMSAPECWRPEGIYRSLCKVPPRTLNAGDYTIGFNAGIPGERNLLYRDSLLRLDIATKEVDRNWALRGFMLPEAAWRVERMKPVCTDLDELNSIGESRIDDAANI